jgi:hypothetical protein
MKFTRLRFSIKDYYSYIKNECFQKDSIILSYSLYNKNINHLFLNKQLITTLYYFSKIKLKNYCIESGRSKNIQKKF